jgi:hypothetical protein
MKRTAFLFCFVLATLASCSPNLSEMIASPTTSTPVLKPSTGTTDFALTPTIVTEKTETFWAILTRDVVRRTTTIAILTKKAQATRTPTPSRTPSPSLTLSPTLTPTPTPTQKLTWNEEISIVSAIDIVEATWSPIAPELVGYLCTFPSTPSEGVYLANAPDFHARRLNPAEFGCTSEWDTVALSWSPNGETIAWSGVGPEGEWHTDTPIWIMDRLDGVIQQMDASGRMLRLPGWMDEQTLVYVGYGGGGTWRSGFVDIQTNTVYALGRTSSSVYPPADDLIPFQVLSPISTFFNSTRVVLRELVENGPVEWDPSEFYPYSKEIPTSGSFSEQENSRFADWFPDGKRMLLLVWEYDTDLEDKNTATALEVWEAEQDTTYLLVPGGIYGRVSPDGRLLAFLTRHPLKLDEQRKPLSEVMTGDVTLLHVMEIAKGSVVLSLPVDPQQISNRVYEEWGGYRPNLISWAPDSSSLVYQNDERNLTIVDITSGHLTPLTTSGGEQLTDPNWSFDGTYLSVTLAEFDDQPHTFILYIP